MSANYRSSPPSAHQQYLDINRGKKKERNITNKQNTVSFVVCLVNPLTMI